MTVETLGCGITHEEHCATWRSYRDDCIDPVTGCGFVMRDLDQCERGHPDDGVTWCGACGHTTLPQPGQCGHSLGPTMYCLGTEGVRRYLNGERCPQHTPDAERARYPEMRKS